jgi:hypothetical protein
MGNPYTTSQKVAIMVLSIAVFCLILLVIGGFLLWSVIYAGRARGAELELPRHGKTIEYRFGDFERPTDGDIDKFGVYSLRYLERRWQRMCDGPQRYDAMREADSLGKPQPCR